MSTNKSVVLSEEDLRAIEARMNAATDGWYIEDEREAVRYGFRVYDKHHKGVCKMTSGSMVYDRSHSEFITHAREDVPALCQTVRALRASDQHNYDLWLTLKERHKHKFKDGNWSDGAADRFCGQCGVSTSEDHAGYDCVAWLQRRLKEVERERDALSGSLKETMILARKASSERGHGHYPRTGLRG